MCDLICVLDQTSYNIYKPFDLEPIKAMGRRTIQLFECGLARFIDDINFDIDNVKHYCHEKPIFPNGCYQNLGNHKVICIDSHLFGSPLEAIKHIRKLDPSLSLKQAKNIVDYYPENSFLKQEKIIEGPFDLQRLTACIRLNTRLLFDCDPVDMKIVVEKQCLETEDYIVSIYRKKHKMFIGYGLSLEKAILQCAYEFKRAVKEKYQDLSKMMEILPKD